MDDSVSNTLIRTQPKPTGVLVIEDNPDHWTIMQATLQLCLPKTVLTWLSDAHSALDYLNDCVTNRRMLPKLILLDLYLPSREQGWQFVQLLKENPHYRHIPIVMLSYSTSTSDICEAYQQGVTSYIVKPTDLDAWLDCFQKLKTYWWDFASLPGKPGRY